MLRVHSVRALMVRSVSSGIAPGVVAGGGVPLSAPRADELGDVRTDGFAVNGDSIFFFFAMGSALGFLVVPIEFCTISPVLGSVLGSSRSSSGSTYLLTTDGTRYHRTSHHEK